MKIEDWTTESFLQEVEMARYTVDALVVQGVLAPGEIYEIKVLAKQLFVGDSPTTSYLRCVRACAVLVRAKRVNAYHAYGRIHSVMSTDSESKPTLQLEAQMNLAARRTLKERAEELKLSLIALYGEE